MSDKNLLFTKIMGSKAGKRRRVNYGVIFNVTTFNSIVNYYDLHSLQTKFASSSCSSVRSARPTQ